MALTLAEAAKYSNDILQIGVIERLVYQDPILSRIQWKDIEGNGLTYNVRTTESGVSFYDVGDTWTESTSVVTQATAVLRIMGGDADIDNFLRATRSNLQDLVQEQIDAKIKAMKDEWTLTFYYGSNAVDAKKFDGMHKLLVSTTANIDNVVAVATSSGTPLALSLERVEKAVDLCKDGADLIVMSKLMRRYINKYLKGVGGITSAEVQGKTIQTLLDVPLAVSDRISNDESADLQYGTNESGTAVYGHNHADGTALGDDDNGTSIFVLKFAPEACCGLQNGIPTVVPIGDLETKDAVRVRIKWYPSIMLEKITTCAKVTGADPDGTVVA